jgi:hypothetical protein
MQMQCNRRGTPISLASFQDAPLGAGPESIFLIVVMHRPGMTNVNPLLTINWAKIAE